MHTAFHFLVHLSLLSQNGRIVGVSLVCYPHSCLANLMCLEGVPALFLITVIAFYIWSQSSQVVPCLLRDRPCLLTNLITASNSNGTDPVLKSWRRSCTFGRDQLPT
ncbi:unnamed protein product [Ixodes pacificus]